MNKEVIPGSENPSPEEENISKIRDILFGNNINEIDRRFNKIEQELHEMITSVKQDLQNQLHSFDDYYKAEVSSILDQIKQEQEIRSAEVDRINKDLDRLNKAILSVKEEMNNNVRDLRSRMMDHYKENSANISKLEQELKKSLNNEVNRLSESKVDRKALALMLSDMAMKISESNE